VFEHYQSARSLLVWFVGKLALLKQKKLVLLRQEVGHYLDQVVVFVLVDCALSREAAVHKDIAFARVRVEVAVQNYLVLLVAASYQLLREVDCGVQQL